MIIDLGRFVAHNRPHWQELESLLGLMEDRSTRELSIDEAKRLHYLYERVSSDLTKVSGFGAEHETRSYLSGLVGRAYAEIYETRNKCRSFSFLNWIRRGFPQTFRAEIHAFGLSLLLTLAGCGFGAYALATDSEAKAVIMPFPHLMGNPADRVKQEESNKGRHLSGNYSRFSAQLMTHNTRVAFTVAALGITWGIGPALMLFYNGVILGAVAFDYIRAGQSIFLLGWLLPHGVIEIPAILVAGQAAFVLTRALIGPSVRKVDAVDPRRSSVRGVRLRAVAPVVATLAGGAAMLLIWAGIIESFVSQSHGAALPYGVKISFGIAELALLTAYLALSGRKAAT